MAEQPGGYIQSSSVFESRALGKLGTVSLAVVGLDTLSVSIRFFA